ncbi:hypothetical protein ACTFIZ_006569 [Dictyostelium cf. discoideum]
MIWFTLDVNKLVYQLAVVQLLEFGFFFFQSPFFANYPFTLLLIGIPTGRCILITPISKFDAFLSYSIQSQIILVKQSLNQCFSLSQIVLFKQISVFNQPRLSHFWFWSYFHQSLSIIIFFDWVVSLALFTNLIVDGNITSCKLFNIVIGSNNVKI